MPFSNYDFCFISPKNRKKREETKVMLKKREKKEKITGKKGEKKPEKN